MRDIPAKLRGVVSALRQRIVVRALVNSIVCAMLFNSVSGSPAFGRDQRAGVTNATKAQTKALEIDPEAQGASGKNEPRPSLFSNGMLDFHRTSVKEPSGLRTSGGHIEAKLPGVNATKNKSDLFGVKEIRITGNTALSDTELLDPKRLPLQYVEKEEKYDFRALHEVLKSPGQMHLVSKTTIQGLTKYILNRYIEKGYAGIFVYVPQNIIIEGKFKNGILEVNVIEGKVAKVTIEHYDFDRGKKEKGILKDSMLRSRVKPGGLINKKKLDYSINLLNLNPDRHISTFVSRGAEENSLNLTYDVYEASPWHWYAQVDDSGTDKRQWAPRVGLVNTNLTGRDDRFAFMYQAPVDSLDENNAVFGSYDFPLFNPRLRLGFYGGYSQFDIAPETAAQGVNFRGQGSFYGTTLRYNLFQWAGYNSSDERSPWFFDLIGSLSHEKSKNNPTLGLSADVDMNLYGLGVELHRSTKRSGTSLLFNKATSFGGGSKTEFNRARANADPDFTIYTLAASHRRSIDEAGIHELCGSLRSIYSDERLVPAKMTTFGGLYTVRGYEEDEVVADGGIIASVQYKFDLSKYLDGPGQIDGEKHNDRSASDSDDWPPRVSLLAYVDHGRAKINDPVPGEKKAVDLWGAGLGATVEIGEHTCGSFYYSWPLRSTSETDSGDGRWNFSFRRLWR
jgi:hemolysin activation/secretion protein